MRNPTSAPGGVGNISKTTPCCSKVGLKRGPWTAEEDEVLANYIKKEGEGRWRTLPKRAGLLRCGKSCRLRWMNYLRPSVKRGHIAPDEEDLILRLHRLLGNRWSLIAGRIPGRTDNEIKNYWNTHLSKKLISQGIDPRTHKPLLLNPSSSASPTSTLPPRNHPYGSSNNYIHNNGHHLQSSSSSPRPPNYPLIRNPNNNLLSPPPPPQHTDEDSPGGSRFLVSSQTEYPHTNGDFDQCTGFNAAVGNSSISNLRNLAISPAMGFRSNNNIDTTSLIGLYVEKGDAKEEEEEEKEEGDMNRCCGGDDVFSSFLNSLINEDAFAGPHEVILQQPNNGVGGGGGASSSTTNTSDALNISPSGAQAIGLDPGWEAAVLSSASACASPFPFRHHHLQNDHHQLRVKVDENHQVDHEKHC